MFLSLALVAATSAIAQPISTSTATPITLGDAYRLALARSETLAQSSAAVAQALAQVDQLVSSVLPHLAVTGTETFQQNPNAGISSIDRTQTPQFQLQLTQPIFSGLREFLAYKAGKRTAEAAAFDERRAEQALYRDVAQSYFDLLRLRNESSIRQQIIQSTEDRIKQLQHWMQIGRSRRSELLAAESQLAQTLADIEIAAGQERVAQELLKFLTGLDEDLAPAETEAGTTDPLGSYLGRALTRSDVEATRRRYDVSKLNTDIAKRQRWPTVSFTGDYYLVRTGFLQNTKYDGIFTASLPIWDFGAITSQVRQNQALERSASEAVSLAERTAAREVRSAYASVESAGRAVTALKKAEEAAKGNLDAQNEDYRNGLVTNLDVLNSISTLESTRLNLNLQLEQAAFARAQLEVAAGGPGSLR
jgi:outer membrane protein